MYRVGFAPWEGRDVAESWREVLEGPTALAPGRALDVGCGSGRDAVFLAKRGWRVTAVDFLEGPLAKAKQRAAEERVDVEWVRGDVARLGQLGLDPGYDLLYDVGCMHGLPDSARRAEAAGLTQLSAPGATLLMTAFKAGRRILLPRGMNQDDLVALLGDGWHLEQSRRVEGPDTPGFIRRASPTVYRLTRRTAAASPS
jgi:SAM-dependent methyltransferase